MKLSPRWKVYAHSHRWADGQLVRDIEDGVIVEFDTHVCSELVAWVLGFGDEAEALGPARLVRAVAERSVQLSPP